MVEGYFLADTVSGYNLKIDFNSIKRTDDNELTGTNNAIDVIDYFNDQKSYFVSGQINGYVQNHEFKLNGRETYKYPFTFKPGEASKTFN